MKRTLLRRVLAMAMTLLFVLAIAAPAMAADYVTVTQSASIRVSTTTSSRLIGTVARGTTLEKLGTSGNFTQVYFRGESGYILTKYVTAGATGNTGNTGNTGSSSTVYATSAVNVRSGPSTSYTKVGELKKGDAVTKVGTVSSWTIVEWNGGTAYISSAYL